MKFNNFKRIDDNGKISQSSKVQNKCNNLSATNGNIQDDNNAKNKTTDSKQNKKLISRFLDILIIIFLILGLYFLIKPLYIARKQDDIMNSLVDILNKQDNEDDNLDLNISTSTTMPNKLDGELIDNNGRWVDANANAIDGEELENFGNSPVESSTAPYFYLQPLGILQIDSIEMNLPILKGATHVPLRYGAGWYDSSATIGNSGRATILGHSMNFNDRFFTELHKIKKSDTIRIIKGNRQYIYQVHDIKFIPENELVNYLIDNEVSSEIMLVTCHNKPSWNQRLLVFAKLIETKS